MGRRNLHRDPTGARLGAPAPHPGEVAHLLENLHRSRRLDWKVIARRAVAKGKGGHLRVLGDRLEVVGVDVDRVLLKDEAGYPIVLPRPETRAYRRAEATRMESSPVGSLAKDRRARRGHGERA